MIDGRGNKDYGEANDKDILLESCAWQESTTGPII